MILIGTYNLGLTFRAFGGASPGPHIGPDLNGVKWIYVQGRHADSSPDDFGSWIFGWKGSAFSSPPDYEIFAGPARGTLFINSAQQLIFMTFRVTGVQSNNLQAILIDEARFA